jgi:choline-glycine betaine transporter
LQERKNFYWAWGNDRWGIRVNPVSFTASVILIWSFAIWCMLDPEGANDKLKDVQRWVSDTMAWMYMLTRQFWVIFLIVLYVSKLGKLKMGKPGDKPEYPTASWFMMMFSCGVGIGLFFFGVAEPIFHYEPCSPGTLGPDGKPTNSFAGFGTNCHGNRMAQQPDNDRAQSAVNLTFFHWGLHAWSAYCVVALLLSAVVYRKELPMTLKSAFYPIIGDKIFGWMGDAIDVLSVVTTLFGICTSLGLGVIQLNAGMPCVVSFGSHFADILQTLHRILLGLAHLHASSGSGKAKSICM